jgi:hypothetical protein
MGRKKIEFRNDIFYKKEYNAWKNMKQRCYTRKDASFAFYKEKGIIVCERWLHSFENFLLDMGVATSENHTVDRIDNNGNYEPSNCRWATRKEQSDNRSVSIKLNYNGVEMSLMDWSKKLKVTQQCISRHMKKGKTFDYLVAHYTKKNNL